MIQHTQSYTGRVQSRFCMLVCFGVSELDTEISPDTGLGSLPHHSPGDQRGDEGATREA